MKAYWLLLVSFGILLAGEGYAEGQENWPQWRGPTLNGVSEAKNLPVTWSESENIAWKVPLPSWSGATPIIWGNRVFIMSPSQGEAEEGGPAILLLCLDKADGHALWQRQLGDGNTMHRKQNDASPSPVTDGVHVWAMSGTGVVAAFTMEGEPVWQKNVQETYGKFGMQFGYGSSPLLYEGRLFIQVLHGFHTDEPSYVLCLDSLTGGEVWRVERVTDAINESPDAYTTPAVLEYEGKTRIIIAGADWVTAHDPETGKEIWRGGGLNPKKSPLFRTIASPVTGDGMVFVSTRKRPLIAFRAGGEGDVTATHTAWKWDTAHGPDVPTPAYDAGLFYMLDDIGAITCIEAKTGEAIWGPERTSRGAVSASPLVADGKVYVTNEDTVTTVLKAGRKFEVLATNTLDGENTLSSIAVSGSQLFLRTATHLYCIGK